MSLESLIETCPHILIADAFLVSNNKINGTYKNIVCSISGGSDSDMMLDILTKIDVNKKIRYVFFNTGFEYKATLEHLDYLESKYNIKIERRKAVKPIPLACREYGVPFLSKYVSEMISRLQKHGFKFEDKPYEELILEYPRCKSALKWWCNLRLRRDGKDGTLNIDRDPYLKEFMITNPPDFQISAKCCTYAKKKVGESFLKDNNADLQLIGIRKAEGGIRSARYKSCFTPGETCDNYRPIFWIGNSVKSLYCKTYGVTNSRCYSEYGLTRTGCAGCPFNNDFESELTVIQTYEPKLCNAVNKVFGKSYEYTRAYREYAKRRREEVSK
jgi:3'-phosphoadenosine 5'-phosphosulfate sulfotransferase (PAPS reductase)/FAD synthetase